MMKPFIKKLGLWLVKLGESGTKDATTPPNDITAKPSPSKETHGTEYGRSQPIKRGMLRETLLSTALFEPWQDDPDCIGGRFDRITVSMESYSDIRITFSFKGTDVIEFPVGTIGVVPTSIVLKDVEGAVKVNFT